MAAVGEDRSRTHAWVLAIVCGLAFLSGWLGIADAGLAAPTDDNSLEYSVKAAFLLKFGTFVEWPPDKNSDARTPLNIGILGEDPFGSQIDQLITVRSEGERPVRVVRIRTIEQAKNMHVLFIGDSEKNRIDSIIAALQGNSVLTVAGFENPGIIISFVIEDNKVRFDINLDQAQRSGLKLSSKLLSVAKNVSGTTKP